MESPSASPVEAIAFPKVSLVGNPSDGYGGATLGLTIANFAATVVARPSEAMRFRDEAAQHTGRAPVDHRRLYGPDNATRLLGATWTVFQKYCADTGRFAASGSCELAARTTIPRQVGLGGSSAIILAALEALSRFQGVAIPPRSRVALAMDIETRALGIEAGLMDRVVQVYDGLLHLECSDAWSVTPLASTALPNLFLAWRDDYAKLSSGRTLSPLAERFRQGDATVHAAMRELAELAARARDALLSGDRETFLTSMDGSMDQRLRLLPDMDPRYLRLVEIGRATGSHVTFPGSGGAVVGSFEDAEHLQRLTAAYGEIGVTVQEIKATQARD
jgi:glucuronokinase